jgi:CheY-like chemotaxis protein
VRICIADDGNSERDVMRGFLERMGHEVVGAYSNGRDALAACRVLKPDALVTDNTMPFLTGLEVVRIVVAEKLVPHVWLASLNLHGPVAQELAALGVGHIAKPFDARKFTVVHG